MLMSMLHVLCRILVSSTRKPISYINLAKRFLQVQTCSSSCQDACPKHPHGLCLPAGACTELFRAGMCAETFHRCIFAVTLSHLACPAGSLVCRDLQLRLLSLLAPALAMSRVSAGALRQEHGEVQLSALGIAVAPMVTVAEILKNRGLAVEKKLCTSLESLSDDYRCTFSTHPQSCTSHIPQSVF